MFEKDSGIAPVKLLLLKFLLNKIQIFKNLLISTQKIINNNYNNINLKNK